MTKTALFVPILVVAVLGGRAFAQAPTTDTPPEAATSTTTVVNLVVGKSTLVDVGSPISRVSLTSADVADALVTAPTQLLVHGKVPGTISMFVWKRSGEVQRYEIAVQRDIEQLATDMRALMPGEQVNVRSNGRFVVLSGTVTTKEAGDRAVNIAAGFAASRDEIVSVLQVLPPAPTDQVLLKVRFAEVSRSALTEFGLSLFTGPTGINNTVGRVTTGQFPAPNFSDMSWSKNSEDFGARVTEASGKFSFSDFLNFFVLSERYDIGLAIRALQQQGLFESLAEPNLVAQSGKEASFLAGGEFPVPVAQGSGANQGITVTFKEFGIRLTFTPTVIGDRVHLKVRPEVSSLDFGNAVVLNGFRIPALSTRRTETELELRDGQTFAIAGLLSNSMNSTMQKVPGIGDIPILGHLFRSRAAQKNQTELVVMITPVILRGNSPGVTATLPRLVEPFMAPVPVNQSVAPPPPAFPQ